MAASPRLTGIKGGLAFNDGLANALTGHGGSADRNIYRQYIQTLPVSHQEVEAAYRGSALLRKVHDLPPQDMTREWRDWQADKKDIAKIEAEEKRLGIRRKVREALKTARIFGGCALVLGAGDRAPERALPANLGVGGLRYINLVSRYTLTFQELDLDPLSELFGQPRMWQFHSATGGQVDIHPSRVIPFIAQPIPQGALGVRHDNFWGDPLLEGIKTAAANSDSVLDGIAALVQEAKVDVIGIPGLMEMAGTTAGENRIMARVALAARAKSIHNAYVRDKEEEYEQKQLSFATLPDIAKLHLMVLAGASDIPVTRLLGKSADGMNATGEGDDKNYDRMIATKQEDELQPAMERLDAVLLPSAGVTAKDATWAFAPLDEPTEKERVEISKGKAERTKIYADLGVLPKEALAKAVQNELLEDLEYPGLDEALEEAEAAGDIPPILEEPEEGVDPITGKPIEPAPDPSAKPPQRKAANDKKGET